MGQFFPVHFLEVLDSVIRTAANFYFVSGISAVLVGSGQSSGASWAQGAPCGTAGTSVEPSRAPGGDRRALEEYNHSCKPHGAKNASQAGKTQA